MEKRVSQLNIELKIALIRRFGSQVNAGDELGLVESLVSKLVRGRRDPTPKQRTLFKNVLGKDYFKAERKG